MEVKVRKSIHGKVATTPEEYKQKGRRFYIKRLYEKGVPQKQIAKMMGITRCRVNALRHDADTFITPTYKEHRDVYAAFKRHYDDVMNDTAPNKRKKSK